MLGEHSKPGMSVVADRFYDQSEFVTGVRNLGLRAHPRAKKKFSRLTKRTTNSAAYKTSMQSRYIVEQPFGWMKAPGRMRQTVFRGLEKVDIQFTMYAIAHNLRRMCA